MIIWKKNIEFRHLGRVLSFLYSPGVFSWVGFVPKHDRFFGMRGILYGSGVIHWIIYLLEDSVFVFLFVLLYNVLRLIRVPNAIHVELVIWMTMYPTICQIIIYCLLSCQLTSSVPKFQNKVMFFQILSL